MLKHNSIWSQSLALTALPNLNPETSSPDSVDLHSFNDRVIRTDNPCVVQREFSNYRKKVVVVGRQQFRKNYETMEEAALRAQIRLTRQQEEPPLFVSLKKQQNRQKVQQSVSRVYIQQPKQKPIKQHMKAIISESHFQAELLSVGKMALLEGERNKKSQSVLIKSVEQEKVQKVMVKPQRYLPCGQLIREINVIKEKFNIQRILTNHITQQQSPKNFNKIISIRAYEQRRGRKPNKNPSQETTEQNNYIMIDSAKLIKPPQHDLSPIASISLSPKIKKPNTPFSDSKEKDRKLRRPKPFTVVPFETYYYRDLLWKVNYTNGLYVEVPIEYQNRLKVHIGRGNNSCMVAGLIKRRPWLTFTDRPEDANFVWTQLKVLSFFRKQPELPQKIEQSIEKSKGYQQSSLLTQIDIEKYTSYLISHGNTEQHCDSRLLPRAKAFQYTRIIKSGQIKDQRMHNHLINNYVIGNKKALFHTMAHYFKQIGQEPFKYLPLTFHIVNGLEDPQYYDFLKYYHKRARENTRKAQVGQTKQYNAWIVKPGENSNRGNGIKVCLILDEIRAAIKIKESYGDGTYRTYIVQQYIQKPLLYHKRKFDLRHYLLMTCINGHIKGYWYRDGYVRITSSEYSLAVGQGKIHLTNDAVQKMLPEYGKFQKGNKLSYEQLSAYIDRRMPSQSGVFYQKIYPRMRQLATHAVRACSGSIDPLKLAHNFELFGLDFMIDGELNVWLIEVNSNPCLQLSCPLLSTLIPRLVENTLQLTLDAIFPPPAKSAPRGNIYSREVQKQNRFQLVFDERIESLRSGPEGFLDEKMLQQQDDVFEDCGDDWDDA